MKSVGSKQSISIVPLGYSDSSSLVQLDFPDNIAIKNQSGFKTTIGLWGTPQRWKGSTAWSFKIF